MRNKFFFFALLFINTALANNFCPKPYTAEYNAQMGGWPLGTATYTLENLGNDRFRMQSNARLLLNQQTEMSEFRWPNKDCQITPLNYQYNRMQLGKHKSYQVNVDLVTHTAHFTENKNPENTFNIPKTVQDPLTEQLIARCQIKSGASKIQLNVIRKDAVNQHTFKRMKEEILQLPAGSFKTIRVEKQDGKKNRQTILWFAPDLDYLLVQLQHGEDGVTYTLKLKSVK